jgi:hypothetical protein
VPASQRDLRLDFFRGLALLFIFIDHMRGNFLSYFTVQEYAFYDAAEMFIFISGFTAALVYGRVLETSGALYAAAQVLRRAWQLYVAHVFLFVIFVAEVSYTVMRFNNPMYAEETRVAGFLAEPHVAVIQALLLQFQPTFLDILPLYIVLLAVFPVILLGLRLHPLVALVPSIFLYVAVQAIGLVVPAYPPGHVWYFNPLAWQFLFISGAALGYAPYRTTGWRKLASWLLPIAIAVVIVTSTIRISWMIHEFWEPFPALLFKQLVPIDKSNLSPIRIVPFFAIVYVIGILVPPDAWFLRSRAAQPLSLCGRHSLEIFCLSILLSAIGHFVLVEYGSGVAAQLAVNAAGMFGLWATARVLDWYRSMGRGAVRQPAAPADAPGLRQEARL